MEGRSLSSSRTNWCHHRYNADLMTIDVLRRVTRWIIHLARRNFESNHALLCRAIIRTDATDVRIYTYKGIRLVSALSFLSIFLSVFVFVSKYLFADAVAIIIDSISFAFHWFCRLREFYSLSILQFLRHIWWSNPIGTIVSRLSIEIKRNEGKRPSASLLASRNVNSIW